LQGGSIDVVVVDTSVFADYYLLYPRYPERHERARTTLDKLSLRDARVYEPFLLEIELRAVLVRIIPPERALEIVSTTLKHVNVVEEEEIHDKAAEIALLTGCRAVDAYYIATANHVNAILITSDKIMRDNARKIGVEAYYLLDNQDYKKLVASLRLG
jgi:predicted nucleic acid-binding protein